jgi:PAS domain S-box-containing protein
MGLTILIVDDSVDDQNLFERALRSTGHTLLKAYSAREGLAMAAQLRPDMILLDFNLPEMNGLEFLERFADRGISVVPVIMLTGAGSERIAVSTMKAGASDYLVKDTEGDYLRLLPSVIRRTSAIHDARMRAHKLSELTEAILETVGEAIVGVDAECAILWANPAAGEFFQCMPSQLVGRHLAEFLRQSDGQTDWTLHPLSQKHNGAERVERKSDLFQPVSGDWFPVAYTASSLDFEGKGRFGWLIVFRKIAG